MDTLRVCANIDLDAITNNVLAMKKALSTDAKIMAVVKTDGYGHGAAPIAKHIEAMDELAGFAVATVDEALELRENGINKMILVLGYTFPAGYRNVILHEIRPTIFTRDMAIAYEDRAKHLRKNVNCHIKIDTGMGRIGYPVTEAAADEIASIFRKCPHLVAEGIFTHFARADETDKTATKEQHKRFILMIEMLKERGVEFSIRHASNSAAIMEYPDAHMDMVRGGIILYGLYPSDEVDKSFPLVPALSLYSHVVHIKTVEKGATISYGGTYVAPSTRRIATIPVGYGDGYSRRLSGRGHVLIRGQRAPIVGRVCMDQFMVDVTDIEGVEVMDEVTLVGFDGDRHISLEDLGDISGRFNYEFACDLGNRIPRLYYHDGEIVTVKEYF